MKNIIVYILLFFSISLFAQTKGTRIRKTNIDLVNVDHIRLCKKLRKAVIVPGGDSGYSEIYRNLNTEQIKYIIDEWNNAEYIGSCKFKPKYYIEIFFKEGTKRTIMLNGALTEQKNYCFQPKDNDFFKNIWEKAKDN